MDWIQVRPSGIFLPPANAWIDPDSARETMVVSHAHADHFPPGGQTVFATAATLALAEARYRKRFAKDPRPQGFGATFQVGPIQVSFLPAGHMLGSAQIFLEFRNQTVLYTGDFNTGDNLCRPLEAPTGKIDLLITESTFGEKPAHSSEIKALEAVVEKANSRPILMGAYSLGKAQRLSELLSRHFPDRLVFIHKSMFRFHKTYESFGYMPGTWTPYRRGLAKKNPGYFYLVPPAVLRSYEHDIRYFKVFASGWDRRDRWHWIDDHLDISDHASGEEIMDYIRKISPGKVWFVHGYPDTLLQQCEELGVEAKSFA